MNSDLIVIKQLPIIEEQLQQVKASVEQRISGALAMACTEDTRVEVKRMRAELRREFDELETRRKAVKQAIIAPYEQFEAVYKDCVANLYRDADQTLGNRVNAVEDGLKQQKTDEARAYFEEYRDSLSIEPEMVRFSQLGLKVNLTTTMKQLRSQIATVMDRIAADLAAIQEHEYKDEILSEYRQSLNLAMAIHTVGERHRRIELERQRREQAEAERQRREEARQKVEAIAAEEAQPEPVAAPIPVEVAAPAPTPAPMNDVDPVLEVTFKVTGPLSKLRELKKFLNDGGYTYE